MKTIKELLGLEEAKDKKKMEGEDPCWDTHQMVGMKKGKGGKPVPNCVPKNEEVELDEASVSVTVQTTAPADKKYAVTEIHPRKSPRGRTRWKDVSYHSSAEEAKTAADAHAKKNNLHRMKSGVSEEVEILDELKDSTISSYTEKAKKDVKELKPFIKKGQSSIAQRISDRRKKGLDMASKRMSEESGLEEASKVETAAEVTKHFEKGQSTPSGVPKWVAEPLKKKKKVVEAGDPELMGGAVSKPTASGKNPKLADKFMKAFKKMKSPANISCKTVSNVSTCEDVSLEEEKLKKSENTSSKDIKKGEKLSGKQEPIKVNPDLKEK